MECFDEVNFAPGANASIEKSKIMQTYSSVKARIKSRFIKDGKLLGKMFLVSSKHAEHDFLEVYLQRRRGEADAKKLFIVDEPLWVVKPSSTYSGKRFQVAYGAKQLMPQVVEPGDDIDGLIRMGYKILDVPVEFEADFRFNIVTSLQDLAGIALPGTTSYFSYKVFSKCYVERPNPFTNEVLQIGIDDAMEYEEFFDFEQIPKHLIHLPIALHIDTALKHDLLGMSAVAYVKNLIEDSDDGLVEKRVYDHLFSVGIQAPPGSEISLAKTRRFIYRLRALGLNVVIISTDTFQSAEFHQILKDKGFNTAIRSLDRTPEGYQILREAMLENRMTLIRHSRLENELIYLQRDSGTGKLDHPPNGCFTGDTLVQLVDGRQLTMLELIEEQQYRTNWVYTVNEETLTIEPKRILSAHQTKLTKKLVEVTLDNGEVITCTPEHRFMLRDGKYCEAQNLTAGTSLMPLYQKLNSDGYSEVYQPAYERWDLEYHAFCPNWSPTPGMVVHHANFNKNDNTPTNLKQITQGSHTRIHNLETHDYTGTAADVREWHKSAKGTQAYMQRSERLRQAAYAYYASKCDGEYKPEIVRKAEHIAEIEAAFGVKWSDLSNVEKNALGNRLARQKDATVVQRISQTLSQRHKEGRFENAIKALSNRIWWTNGVQNLYIKADEQPPAGYRRGRVMKRNHKVVSVRFIEKPTRVYDLNIEDNPNFALACGVFVHNSKDISDSLAGAVWDLSLLPYQPSLTNYRMEYSSGEEDLPACFNHEMGGLRPLNKYQFDRI